jgi:hypothetical protein
MTKDLAPADEIPIDQDDKKDKYLKQLDRYEKQIAMWRGAHGDRVAPPIFEGQDGNLKWVNRKQRRALNKKRGSRG